MAKLRRAKPEPAKRKAAEKPHPGKAKAAARPSTPPAPAKTTYMVALGEYERALQAMQQRRFAEAARQFTTILASFPDERDLLERSRLYLTLCQRQIQPKATPEPKTLEDRAFAATVAVNAGDYDKALGYLTAIGHEADENDHVQYLLAVVHALKGNKDESLNRLERAVHLNPELSTQARQNVDFESLAGEARFQAALDSANAHRIKRAQPRSRPN